MNNKELIYIIMMASVVVHFYGKSESKEHPIEKYFPQDTFQRIYLTSGSSITASPADLESIKTIQNN